MITGDNLNEIVKGEIELLLSNIKGSAKGPEEVEAMNRISRNMAMLPIWIASGLDVTDLVKDMKAEALLRGVAFTLESQALAQQAWMNVLTKVVGLVITTALS